jgi:hypothetical protein
MIPIITSLAEAPKGDAWLEDMTSRHATVWVPVRDGKPAWYVKSVAGWGAECFGYDSYTPSGNYPKLQVESIFSGRLWAASEQEAIAEHLKTQPFGEVRLKIDEFGMWFEGSGDELLVAWSCKTGIGQRFPDPKWKEFKSIHALEALVLEWWERGPESRIGQAIAREGR